MKSSKSELQKLSEWLNVERPEFPWSAVQGFASYWRDRKILYPVAAILKKAPCSCDSGDLEGSNTTRREAIYPVLPAPGISVSLRKRSMRYWNFQREKPLPPFCPAAGMQGSRRRLIPAKLWKLGQTAHHLGGQPSPMSISRCG
jgi:hypothetical protein